MTKQPPKIKKPLVVEIKEKPRARPHNKQYLISALLHKPFSWIFAIFCKKYPSQMFHKVLHYVKSVRIRSYSDPYFPFFGLKNNSETEQFRTRTIQNRISRKDSN